MQKKSKNKGNYQKVEKRHWLKREKVNKNLIKQNAGITLLELCITIIVIIILASITIGAISGDNGILGNAGKAKENTEISNEKEIISVAVVKAMGKNNRGNLKEDEFQEKLNNQVGKEGIVEVAEAGEYFEVLFTESNRYYEVDKDGNIGEVQEFVKDENPGDITVGQNGEKLDGSEAHPYEIWCIEDLVKLSQMVNEENNQLTNQYVVLKKDLDFNSSLSYADANTTEFDIYLGGDGTNPLKQQLSEEGKGFEPIGKPMTAANVFEANFDGENHIIRNIYINKSGDAALFGATRGSNGVGRSKIMNLSIEGKIIGGQGQRTAGLTAWANNVIIENCNSYVNIQGNSYGMGGIVGICQYGDVDILNCANYGSLENTYSGTGGIIGVIQSGIQVNITNSYNDGKIKGTNNVGGIVGWKIGETNIYNSYQIGEITGNNNVGGIIGNANDNTILRNIYSIGNINCLNTYGGIIGGVSDSSKINSNNVYYIKNNNLTGIYNEEDEKFNITGFSNEEWDSNAIINYLNEGKNIQEEGIDKTNWKAWLLGENGYPTF